jgi:valyl-tRNA synthetase
LVEFLEKVRGTTLVGQSPGNDSKLYEEKIAGYRNFINKLWNASRFVLMIVESDHSSPVDFGAVDVERGEVGRCLVFRQYWGDF